MNRLRRRAWFAPVAAAHIALLAPHWMYTAAASAGSYHVAQENRQDAVGEACGGAPEKIVRAARPLGAPRTACPPRHVAGASRPLALADAVQKGRNALGSGWQYPWYDAKTDDVRRVDVRQTWNWRDWNWKPGGFRLNWMQFLFWTAIALILGLLAYFLIRAYLSRENRRALATGGEHGVRSVDDAHRIASLPFQVDKRALNPREQAWRYYQAGNYRQAIIYLFSHQLVELDRRQLIRLAKGKTNRQYVREVASAGVIRDLLEQTMVAFEDVFFGNHPLDRARFESCWNRVDEFDRLAAQVPS